MRFVSLRHCVSNKIRKKLLTVKPLFLRAVYCADGDPAVMATYCHALLGLNKKNNPPMRHLFHATIEGLLFFEAV